MGNSQKKLGKSSKKAKDDSKRARVSRHDTTEHVEILLKKGPISEYYDVDPNTVLGRGHYATVNLGVDKKSGLKVAVKRIQISKSRVEALKREVEVLRKVGKHPNIVTLYDIFITETELILVLELLLGGELFDRMVEKGPYSEREASHHIRKIGQALKFLHRHGIVHRDLKPENLILAHKGDDSELKIADFGLAHIVDNVESATMRTVCGTWAYCAPEVKTTMVEEGGPACYTAKVDLWSVGVILFVILGAYHPFDADGDASDAQLWSNICSGVFDFDDPAWDHISAGAKDLIKNLIVVDADRRYGTDELLAHPWVKQAASVPATPITPNIDRSLIDFNGRRKNKKSFVSQVKRGFIGGGGDSNSAAAMQQRLVAEQQQLLLKQQQYQEKEQQQLMLRQQFLQLQQYHAQQQQQLQLQFEQEQQSEQDPQQRQARLQYYQQQMQHLQLQQQQQQQQLKTQLEQQYAQQQRTQVRFADEATGNGASATGQNGKPDNTPSDSMEEEEEEAPPIPQLTLNTLLSDQDTQSAAVSGMAMDVETPVAPKQQS
uniref:Protein kinase domain-containing protein n=1 Tax=Mucochytrium quahogii TaxID=96639 RepID=A0A7S2WMN5_9STRA